MVAAKLRQTMVENARRGAARRNEILTPAERIASAKHAVRARWARAKRPSHA
jgi:hypothetical protein